jgi:outer membrane biosynthesis protein TonB
MDGALLVFDSRSLPNGHALATVSGSLPDKAPRRGRMVPAFATLILMVLVATVYYMTALRSSTAANDFSPASVTSVPAEPPVAQPSLEPQVSAPAAVPEPTPESNEKPETQPATAPKPAAVPAKKAVNQPATTSKPEPKKDDSKVGSILKKTGKILKKPFKF